MRSSAVCMKSESNWVRLLAYVTGLVNQELLLQNEYLAAENRILKAYLPSRVQPTDSERATLAEIGKRLGRKALREVASRTRFLRLLRVSPLPNYRTTVH